MARHNASHVPGSGAVVQPRRFKSAEVRGGFGVVSSSFGFQLLRLGWVPGF